MSPNPPLPKNWPPSISYLTKSHHSPSLQHDLLALTTLHTKPTESPPVPTIPTTHTRGPSPLVKILPITNASHPAHGQFGLFATRDLKPETFIILYRGVLHVSAPNAPDPKVSEHISAAAADLPTAVSEPTAVKTAAAAAAAQTDPHSQSDYDLSLDRYTGLAIDAAEAGNEARFINDYRGVPGGSGPNAEFRDVWDERVGERGMGVWVLSMRKGMGCRARIRKGEEILVSYGRGFWDGRKGSGEESGIDWC